MSTATIPVSPTLQRTDGSSLALTDLSAIEGFLAIKPTDTTITPVFTSIGKLAPASVVTFTIPDLTPGDYLFYATETDNQKTPLTSNPSSQASFNVPVPVVVLAAPAAPSVGTIAVA